jgi:hypothetical protein
MCRWTGPREGELGPERVALGAALAQLWPGVDAERFPAPSADMLGYRAPRRMSVSPALRWAAIAAIAVVGLSALASAWKERAADELSRLQARSEALKPAVDDVERLRKRNESLVAAHDRLRRLEDSYVPRWRTLAALSSATPRSAWVESLQITDQWVYLDVVSASAADLIQAIEGDPSFEAARQSTPGSPTDVAGEARFRIEARMAPRGKPAEGGA